MISKWFIQDHKKKSLGYYKEFSSSVWYSNRRANKGRPSFTKQTALATFFDSEQDAIDHLEKVGTNLENNIKEIKRKLKACNDIKGKWEDVKPQEKINLIAENEICITYREKSQWGHAYDRRFEPRKYNYHNNQSPIRKVSDLSEEEKDALAHPNWEQTVTQIQDPLSMYEAQLDYLTKYLRPFEQTMEFKFKDSERKHIEWSVRDDKQTKWGYCNGCGGAIPSIPQVRIGYEVTLCAICMGKLAQEAQIQLEKIPEDLLEHYETDRFLRKI